MKPKSFSLFRRIAILIFSLITILGILFIAITYFAITHYHQASTQLLNKDVAAHIAKFTSPFENGIINKQKADSVFYDAMVLSPSAEVYFLDTTGRVIAFHAPQSEIKLWQLPLDGINRYIAAQGREYIKAPDPKDPAHTKIFSAAEVYGKTKRLGYIYVILGSKSSENIIGLLFGSHISSLAIEAFLAIIILSILISTFYLTRMQRSFNRMIAVLQRFEGGDYTARFQTKEQNELTPVTQAFNNMANLLENTINSLTHSEQERKDFIATISHDLRTPLAIARGYTETLLLKQDVLTDEEKAQYFQLILQKMLQVEDMVKQLFELSKMEAVAFTPHREPFVLSEIVQETVNTFKLQATQKNISLKCAQCQYHVWINADTAMMEHVVQNLVDNAVKSTPEGGAIESGLSVEGTDLVFKIDNTGLALSQELLEWINRCSEEQSLRSRRPAKAGLGLVIIQKILLLHGSCLKAVVQDGHNIFTFRMPISHPAS